MNILIVYAHPEPQSLNGSLKDFAVQQLESQGHAVQVSDLYSMNWKPQIDAGDNTAYQDDHPFHPSLDSKSAFENATQSADIAAEQEKLQQADAVIFQFPLWWFSMPAIMKGWFERVYAYGFAYGVGEHSDTHWGDRYGEGNMAGKRAMLVVTTGGWDSHFSPRGINGPIDDILFPIQHGVLHYPGFDVLPPLVFYRTGRIDELRFNELCEEYGQRLDNLFTTNPLPYRQQNGGDYHIPALTLKDEFATGEEGLRIHLKG